MKEDLLIRIHELSKAACGFDLDKFSTDNVKKDLADLVVSLRDIDVVSYNSVSDDYTGICRDGDSVHYVFNGNKIFSRLDETLGVECGLLNFKKEMNGIEYNLNFEYRGGWRDTSGVVIEGGGILEEVKESLKYESLKVFNPKRNAINFQGNISWLMRQDFENQMYFRAIDNSLSRIIQVYYGGPYGSKNFSEMKELQDNLHSFESFDDVKFFFSDKKTDYGTWIDGISVELGLPFRNFFKKGV